MANRDTKISVDADFNDAMKNTVAFNQVLDAQNQHLAEVTKQMNTYNSAGQIVKSVTQGLTAEGQKFNIVMREMKVLIAAAIPKSATSAAIPAVYAKQFLPDKASFTDAKKSIAELGEEAERAAKKAEAANKRAAAELKKSEDAVRKLGLGTTEAAGKLGVLETNVNKVVSAFKYFVAYRAFNAITSSIEEGTAAANKFQIQLSLIRTISQDNQVTFSGLSKSVRRVSDTSGFSLNDTAKAFYDAKSNQIATPDLEPFVKSASDLARVTGSTLPDANNILTASINAYGLSAKDAERVSAILFHTVDEGRIVLSEVANTFGRAGVLAKSLGVGIEDVASTLSITTQKGFKTADAMTLITNLLIKLEKPTEATQKLFASLGVTTGDEAARLFGFTGIIQKMIDLTKSGVVPVSAFFDEIRGRKQFAVFEQSLPEIEASIAKNKDVAALQATYNKAKDIRAESPADSINKQVEQVKNFFTEDIGQKILKQVDGILKLGGAVVEVTGQLKGLNGEVTEFAEIALGAVALAFGRATAQTLIWGTSTVTTTAAVTALGTATTATAVATDTLSTSTTVAAINIRTRFLSMLLPVAAITAAIYAAYEATKLLATVVNKVKGFEIKGDQATSEDTQKLKDFLAEQNKAKPTDTLSYSDRAAGETYKQVLGIIAQASLANNKLLDDVKHKGKDAAEAVKLSFSTYTDTLKNNISDLHKKISDAKTQLEQSAKAGLKFSESISESRTRFREEYALGSELGAGANQKIPLAQQEFDRLKAKAADLFSKGDQDSIREAEAVLKEAIAANDKLSRLEQDQQAHTFAQGVKENPQFYGNGPAIRFVDDKAHNSRLTELEVIRNKGAAKEAKDLNNSIALNQTKVEQLKTQERLLQDLFRQYEKLTPFNDKGEIKEEYKDLTTGKYNAAKFNKEQDELESKITDAAGTSKSGDTADPRFQLETSLHVFKLNLIKQTAIAERQAALETAADKVRIQEAGYTKQIADAKKLREEGVADQLKGQGILESTIKQGTSTEAAYKQLFEKELTNPVTGGKYKINDVDSDAKRTLAAAGNARADLEAKKNAQSKNATRLPDGTSVYREEDITATNRALEIYIGFLESLRKFGPKSADGTQVADATAGGLGTDDVSQTGEGALKLIRQGRQKIGAGISKEEEAITGRGKAFTQLQELAKQFPDLQKAAIEAGTRTDKAFNDAAKGGIDIAIQKIKELQTELDKLGGNNKKSSLDLDNSGNAFVTSGNGEVYAASGGIVGMFPGQPRGVDRYPIWAAAGETIVNAETSRMYRPMLEAIMQRRAPRYMSGGGVVGSNTTVGDINVTVQGATTNEDTGRSLAMRLNRETRRRNINLF